MEGNAKDLVEAIGLSNVKNDREPVATKNIKRPPPVPSPILKSPEIKRTFNIGTILAEAANKVFKKEKEDTFGKTALTPAEKAKQGIQKAEEQKKKPFKFPLLATLALGITAFATWLADFLGPVGEFITKTLPKLFKPMSKIAGGFFKAVKGGKLLITLKGLAKGIGGRLLKFGRFIPVLGSLFSFGFGIARWKKGEYMPAIFEFVSGILNLLPFGVTNAASMIIDGALLLYDLNKTKKGDGADEVKPKGGFDFWGKIAGFALNLPGVRNIIALGKGVGAIFKGDFDEAAVYFLEALPGVGWMVKWLADESKKSADAKGEEWAGRGSLWEPIKDKFVSIFKGIVDSILNAFVGVGEWFSKLGKGFKAAFKALAPFGESPMEAFSRVMNMNDGAVLTKGNKLVRFNTKDDILAMKPGGVVEKFLKGSHVNTEKQITGLSDKLAGIMKGFHNQTKEIMKTNQGFFTKSLNVAGSLGTAVYKGLGAVTKDFLGTEGIIVEIKTSNQHLGQLVQLTAQLVAGQGQTAAPIPNITIPQQNNDMSGSMGGPTYSDGRFDYTNSTYHMSPT